MHTHSIERWQHSHVFLGEHHARNERRTWLVIGLTTAMMVGEIAGGTLFGSLALVADGLHMSTHAAALIIAAAAYGFARRHARDARFAFGTGKLGDLAGYSSAIVLAMIAAFIVYQSVARLIQPVPIAFAQAIPVAFLGLAVNLASAFLLREEDHHHHDRGADEHHHQDHDHNLRAAYLHVLADAATSVLAILGLLAGALFGWVFMDPVMGLVGALVIANWSFGLMRDAGAVLLDVTPDPELAHRVRAALERGDDRVTDLHLWRVGPGRYGAIIALVSDAPLLPAEYKARLGFLRELAHVTIEVEACV
jgi:cation diffusion facilitator family transporter